MENRTAWQRPGGTGAPVSYHSSHTAPRRVNCIPAYRLKSVLVFRRMGEHYAATPGRLVACGTSWRNLLATDEGWNRAPRMLCAK